MLDDPCVRAFKRKTVGRDILGYRRTRARCSILTYLDGSDKVGVAAYERMITDLCPVFINTVVVRRDASAAEINAFSDIAVAEVCKVSDGSIYAYLGILYLNEVADLDAVVDHRTRTQLYERTYLHTVADLRIVCLYRIKNGIVTDRTVFCHYFLLYVR